MASSRKSDHLENILENWFACHDLNGGKSEPSPNLSEKPVYGVAVSGGMDSMALLHALSALSSRYNFSLLALHVHHGLHLLADHWEDFCRHEAQLLGVPFWGARVQIKATGKGLEAARGKVVMKPWRKHQCKAFFLPITKMIKLKRC